MAIPLREIWADQRSPTFVSRGLQHLSAILPCHTLIQAHMHSLGSGNFP